MKDDVHRHVQRYGWDQAASHYETCWTNPLRSAFDALLNQANLSSGQTVLDVACGTGLVTFPAANAVSPGGEVVAIDLSGGMIDRARATAKARDIRNVTFSRMDAEALDLPAGAFDVALCSLGLMYVAHPARAIRELHRVLAPEGRAVASVWGRRTNCGWADVFPIVDRRVETDVCPRFFHLGGENVLETAFRSAGFSSVSTKRIRTRLLFPSMKTACDAVFEGGPVALAWDRFDSSTREAARSEYQESISPYQNGDGVAIPGEFVITSGRKPAS